MHPRSKAPDSPIARVRGTLGPLERQVMEVLWRKKECSVRDVVDRLPHAKAYTTVMTTLSRLFHRGLVTRLRVERKFVYSARVDHLELDLLLAHKALSYLIELQVRSKSPERVSFYILNHLFQHDPRLFDSVVRMVKSQGSEQLTRMPASRAANADTART